MFIYSKLKLTILCCIGMIVVLGCSQKGSVSSSNNDNSNQELTASKGSNIKITLTI